MSSWREAAERRVAEIHATLPVNADLKTRRRALRSAAGWPAHQGTAWGRKMWDRVVREYLARYDRAIAGPLFGPTRLDAENARLRAGRSGAP